MKAPALFGTDGIRARPFEHPLSHEVLRGLGSAFSKILGRGSGRPVLFARDTRLSGPSILADLRPGFEKNGFKAVDLGVLPTPAVGYLTSQWGAALGCMISASHNPPEFNGVKFFSSQGGKISRVWEEQVEGWIAANSTRPAGKSSRRSSGDAGNGFRRYRDFLRSSLAADVDLSGLHVAFDGAEGAASILMPELLENLGARVTRLSCGGHGGKINADCGALHPGRLAQTVRRLKCDIGFAVDGDADRLVVVDEKGNALPGERVMATVALDRRERREPGAGALVTTVVSNFALKRFMEKNSFAVLETPVGDRWVLEALLKNRLGFGGENSGHYIWPFLLPSADACLGALQILELVKRKQKSASRAFVRFALFPHAGIQVPAEIKPDLDRLADFQQALRRARLELGSRGRVLARYSGTEPLLRILIEGDLSLAKLQGWCQKLGQAFLKETR